MDMSDFAIVTGGDEHYASLIEELLLSIREKREGKGVPIAVLDGGLSDETARLFQSKYQARVVRTDWQYPLPGRRIRGRDYLRVEIG